MGFITLFIGLIISIVDFRLGTVNILPDIIGYFLMLIGMREVYKHFPIKEFTEAKKYAAILLILSFLQVVVENVQTLNLILNTNQTTEGIIYSFIFQLLFLVSFIVYFYYLCIGIKKEATVVENVSLQKKSDYVFKMLVVFQVISSGSFILSIFIKTKITYSIDSGITVLLGILLIFGLLVYVIYHVYKMLSWANVYLKPNS